MSNDRYQKIRDALAGVAERESLRQRAAAWDAVADTLGEVCPEWINHPGTGTEAAVAAIRKLAQQPEARVGGEVSYAECCDTPAYCSSVRRCTAKDTPPPSAVPEIVGWLHEVVWEDGTAYSFYRNQPGLLGPRPGLVSERIGRAAFIAAAPEPEEGE